MDSSNILIIIGIIISLCATFGLTRTPPSYIDLCHQADPKIEECLKNAAEQVKPHLSKGVAELGIPPFGPLIIPIAELRGPGLRASFINTSVYDLDKFEIKDIHMDIPNSHVDFKVKFGTIRTEGIYELDGTLLVFRLKGSGPATMSFESSVAECTLEGSRFIKNGKEYLKWNKKKCNIKLEKPLFHFDNLFGDDKDLNERTNRAINDNGEAFMQELQPIIDESVSKVLLAMFDHMFAKYALKELFRGF